jgi:light-regulated signal transduction histidine kinase (bacteriophytochrome)
MGNLIDDLLAFSRLGRQDLTKKSVAPVDVVKQAIEDLHADREGRDVEISIGDLPVCEADPQLIRQVFVNLIANALKYTRPSEKARIEIGWTRLGELKRQLSHEQLQAIPSAVSDPELPVYFVRDNGVGFEMKYADKLFGVFQRLHRQEDFEGTGVGLATVQRIIKRHGGCIWAYSEIGKGATFYLTLGTCAVGLPKRIAVSTA